MLASFKHFPFLYENMSKSKSDENDCVHRRTTDDKQNCPYYLWSESHEEKLCNCYVTFQFCQNSRSS
jgi:hypothetical protein